MSWHGHSQSSQMMVAGAPRSNDSMLATIMAMRGLDIAAESTFDFTVPEGCKEWPAPHYGPYSPHREHQKVSSTHRHKRLPPSVFSTRPAKVRKPKKTPTKAARSQPLTRHGVIPPRDQLLQLLTLPGELRDMIYYLLAVHESPLYPQYRPCFQGGRSKQQMVRRYPLEPTLAHVNRQLRREVLSVFYGANKFIFEKSRGPMLHKLSMADAAWLRTWLLACPSSDHLRSVELRFNARFRERPIVITYKLERSLEGSLQLTHDLSTTQYCTCIEDGVVDDIKSAAPFARNLACVAVEISQQRKMAVARVTTKDGGAGGMLKLQSAMCFRCRKKHLSHLSVG